VNRGEIWTAAGGRDYADKPRPIVIVQDDRFDATNSNSITICAFTSDPTDAPLFRLVVEPSEANGLDTVSRLMVDIVLVELDVDGRARRAVWEAEQLEQAQARSDALRLDPLRIPPNAATRIGRVRRP